MLPSLLALALLPSAAGVAARGEGIEKNETWGIAQHSSPAGFDHGPALPAEVETEEDDSRDERVREEISESESCAPLTSHQVAFVAGVGVARHRHATRACCAVPRAPPLA
ncbi:MAG: hypothetical protein KC503_00635 [Myxococcales bacterium]|nr:hypothetical protein [Myxococcales bacterium]